MQTLKNRKKSVSGFTLIELLLVMGILAMITSVVLFQAVTAVSKGSDAGIKGDLANVQAVATLDFFNLGRRYSATGAAITGADCSTLSTPNTIFANPKIRAALLDIKDLNAGIALTCNVAADGSAYAIAATLKTAGTYFCIDSTGAQKSTYGTGTIGYTGQTGGTGSVAIFTGAFSCQ